MSAFSVENPHDGKTFENYTRFEWGVEVGVATTFMLRLFVPHEFDMVRNLSQLSCAEFERESSKRFSIDLPIIKKEKKRQAHFFFSFYFL